MPLGDRKGPLNQGPKTGRSAGTCAGYDHPGYLNPNVNQGREGRGLGIGPLRGGLGRGRRLPRGRDLSISSISSQNVWSDGPPD